MKHGLLKVLPVCLVWLVTGCGLENSSDPSSIGSFSPADPFSDFTSNPVACLPTETTGAISGTVKESVQKFQIWGAGVTASGQGASPIRAFTNDQGLYTICGLFPGTYQVSAAAAGFEASAGSTRQNVAVQAGVTTEGIDLDLALPSQQPPSNVGAVSGRVVSAQPPNPGIENAHVEAWVDTQITNNQIVTGQKVNETLANDQGEFFLTPGIGTYTLAIYKEGFSPNPRLIIGVVIHSESVTTLSKDVLLFPG